MRERAHKLGRGAEAEAVSPKSRKTDEGLNLIMTWAEGKHATHWVTQAPQEGLTPLIFEVIYQSFTQSIEKKACLPGNKLFSWVYWTDAFYVWSKG